MPPTSDLWSTFANTRSGRSVPPRCINYAEKVTFEHSLKKVEADGPSQDGSPRRGNPPSMEEF